MGKNNKKVIDIVRAERTMFKSDEEFKEYLEFVKRAEQFEVEFFKRQKRLKIYAFALIGFMLSLVIVAILSFIFPSFEYISDMYFLFCNFISVFICGWSFFSLIKTNKQMKIKDKTFPLMIMFSVFALLLNIAIILNELFFHFI